MDQITPHQDQYQEIADASFFRADEQAS